MYSRKTIAKVLSIFLFSIASNSLLAQTITTPMGAGSLALACSQSESSQYSDGFCDGAIEAIYSVMEGWCVPENVTHGQVKALVKAGLSARRNWQPLESAEEVINRLIREAWPCISQN